MVQTAFELDLKKLNIATETEEQVFEIVHKHWGRVIWPLFGLSLLLGITSFSVILLLVTGLLASPSTGVFFVILGIWYFALIFYGLSEWFSFRQSALIITNQRLIDCQQLTFLTRRVQTIDIYEVQSCTGEAGGGWGTIFNYGNLFVNTLGDRPVCVSFIPAPEVISGEVMHYHNLIAHASTPHREEEKRGKKAALPDAAIIETVADWPQPAAAEPFIERASSTNVKQEGKETASQKSMTLLMFHIPSENLAAVLKDLPAQKEPTVTYLEKTDYYEIQTIVPTETTKELVTLLKSKGAEDIVGNELQSMD